MAKDKKKERELKKREQKKRQELKELQEKRQKKQYVDMCMKMGEAWEKLKALQEEGAREEENYKEPREIKTQEMPGHEKYPYFKLQVSYDVDHPEEVEEAQKSFYQALALLESTKVGARLLSSFKNNYETQGTQTTIDLYPGNAGLYERTKTPYLAMSNSFIYEKLSGKSQHEPSIEIYASVKNPEELAKLLSHELAHERHNTQVLPMIFQGEKLDILDACMGDFLTELFAYQQNRAYLFERFGTSDSYMYNYLAAHTEDAPNMHRSELAEQTALNVIQADINDIPPSELISQLPRMTKNFDPKMYAVFREYLQEELKTSKKRSLYPLFGMLGNLAETQIPMENMTIEGKNLPHLFNAFLQTDFPDRGEIQNSFNLETKVDECIQDFIGLTIEFGKFIYETEKSEEKIDKLGEILVFATGDEKSKEIYQNIVKNGYPSKGTERYHKFIQGLEGDFKPLQNEVEQILENHQLEQDKIGNILRQRQNSR